MALSHDNTLVVSVSSSSAKVWRSTNSSTGYECIRTIEIGYGLCVAFLPGDRHVVVGTKTGGLQLLSLGAAAVVEDTEDAHEGSIWSLAMRPDRTGFATGGADKQVKFWEFDIVEKDGDDASGRAPQQQLSLVHTRTLKMTDEVLCVRYSHARTAEKALLAVALLDSTVKLFHDDTLKFHLSLYGHKLPVMSLDISSDDTLLVSASSDKDIKLWGLDFGDCHKSIFAHSDAVMSVAFVRGTHFFFSAGKDGVIKYWDGDTYNQILELAGHTREAWGCVVSNDGEFVISCSHDRSLRVWERTQDQVFLEEERENRMERSFFEETLGRHDQTKRAAIEYPGADATAAVESEAAGKQSLVSVKSAERLIEAIELVAHEEARLEELQREGSKGRSNPLLLGLSPLKYMLRKLQKIRSSDLEQALLVMPFHLVELLLKHLAAFTKACLAPELTTRCTLFVLRLHHGPITASRKLQPLLLQLQKHLRSTLQLHRERIGVNLAGLRMMQRITESERSAEFYVDSSRIETAPMESATGDTEDQVVVQRKKRRRQ